MPRGDQTGPAGMGPMTGRGAGLCSGHQFPGYANSYGRGGCGRGFGRMNYANSVPAQNRFRGFNNFEDSRVEFDEKKILGEQAVFLEEQLKHVKGRLSEIDGNKEK